MSPPDRQTLGPLLEDAAALWAPERALALGRQLGAEPEATARLLQAGVPLVLVALVQWAATSTAADRLPALLDRAGARIPGPDDGAPDAVAAAVLGALLRARRAAVEAQLQRLSGLDPTSVHGVLATVALRLVSSLARLQEASGRSARTLCRELGAALTRAEDAAPGSIGAFEELLEGEGPVEEDLVRVGRALLESLDRPPRRVPG